MRTVGETDIFPVCSLPAARNAAELFCTSRRISPRQSRCNSASSCSDAGSITADYIVIHPLSPTSLLPSNASTDGEANDAEIDYLTEYICPSDAEDEPFFSHDDSCDNDEIFLQNHLSKKQLDFVERCEQKAHRRAQQSHKKMNAKRQIKTKHAKSIKIKSHNNSLYIHHRLANKILVDERSLNCIPSSPRARPLTEEEVRMVLFQHRHGYTPLFTEYSPTRRKPRHVVLQDHAYTDESPINAAAHQFREYTLNEYNIPDEPSYDETMVNFLLDMQNRELSPEDYEMLLRLDERVQRKTVSANVLETLPTVTADDSHAGEQCTICMEAYSLGQQLKLLPCEHIFHSDCIETYLKEFSIQCPLDNLPLV